MAWVDAGMSGNGASMRAISWTLRAFRQWFVSYGAAVIGAIACRVTTELLDPCTGYWGPQAAPCPGWGMGKGEFAGE